MRKIVFILMFAIAGCEAAVEATEKMDISIRDTILKVPTKYMLPNLPRSMVPSSKGMDASVSSISIRVPLGDIGIYIAEKKGPAATILSHIYSSSDVSKENDQIARAWEARGEYKDRIVEYDSEQKLWRIYRKATYPRVWFFFDKDPEKHVAESAVAYVASCLLSPSAPLELSYARCHKELHYKKLFNDIVFSGRDFDSLDKIVAAYQALLEQWLVE